MWKNYSLFFNQAIKSEISYMLLLKNTYKAPYINKVIVANLTKTSLTTKKILMLLCGLEVLAQKKSSLIKSKKTDIAKKTRKGKLLGSKVALLGNRAEKKFHFLVFIIIPQLDLVEGFLYKKKSADIKFIIKTPKIFAKFNPFLHFFQKAPQTQVIFSLKNSCQKGDLFFFRLLKLPVYSK